MTLKELSDLELRLNTVGFSMALSKNNADRSVFLLLTDLVADNQRLQAEVDKLWKVLNARTEHLV